MDTKRALKLLPGPDPRGERRIWRRYARSRAERRHRMVRGVAMAALVAALLALGLLAAWPEPTRTLTLAGRAESAERVVWSAGIVLTAAGSGEARGTSDNVVVDWHLGELEVRVEPGTAIAVIADEGRIEVRGPSTVTVQRDALGLMARVGQVATVDVACNNGSAHRLVGPAAPVTCWPRSPARLLGRADTLHDRGASPQVIRATLDRALLALAEDDASPVRGELLVRRMRVLRGLGEAAAALADSDAYVAMSGPRVDEVRRFAVDVALMDLGDCEGAMKHLDALRADPDPSFRFVRRVCLQRRGSGRAGTVAVRADAVDVKATSLDNPPTEQVIRWLKSLGERP